jgi:hypothetical protein
MEWWSDYSVKPKFGSLYKGYDVPDGQYNLKTIYMLNSTADVIK